MPPLPTTGPLKDIRVLDLTWPEAVVPAMRQLVVLSTAILAAWAAGRFGGPLAALAVLGLTYLAMTWLLQRRMIGALRVRMTGGLRDRVAT